MLTQLGGEILDAVRSFGNNPLLHLHSQVDMAKFVYYKILETKKNIVATEPFSNGKNEFVMKHVLHGISTTLVLKFVVEEYFNTITVILSVSEVQ